MHILLAFVTTNPLWTWLLRLGGPGLIALGLADNSAIPLPGSMDLLLILLAARQPRWWHTAVIKFVENRFIGSSTHLTQRDAAQPDLLDFFDFTTGPWTTPPSPPAPTTPNPATCTPSDM